MRDVSLAVLIPTCNAEDHICEALDSVTTQSRRPDEIIVADDGSKDHTVEVVRRWSKTRGVEVILIEQENRGVASARNHGLRHIHADFVALLDADDLFLPHHLEQTAIAFQLYPDIVLCFADAEVFSREGIKRTSFLAGTSIETLEWDEHVGGLRLIRGSAYSSLLRGNYIPVSSTVFSKKAVERVGLYDESFIHAADRDLNLRLSRCGQFAYYASISARKRTHENNLSHPRYHLRAQRHRLGVLQKMEESADKLGLSFVEVQETRKAIADHVIGMLYAASRRGVRTYLGTCAYLIQKGLIAHLTNSKHLLRALAFSTVMAQADESSA